MAFLKVTARSLSPLVVCYEVTDLFYTNLRQHTESMVSQRSDIYFDEQVWERVENIYNYYKDRDVLNRRSSLIKDNLRV